MKRMEGRVRARWMFVTLLLLVPSLTVGADDQALLIYLEQRSAAHAEQRLRRRLGQRTEP